MKSFQKISKRINNNLKLLTIALTLGLFSLTSCGGDDVVSAATGCGSNQWSVDYEAAISKFSNAAQEYSNNPTSENCKKYKDAGLDYVKTFKSITKCIPGASKKTYEQAFNELKNEIESINCN